MTQFWKGKYNILYGNFNPDDNNNDIDIARKINNNLHLYTQSILKQLEIIKQQIKPSELYTLIQKQRYRKS